MWFRNMLCADVNWSKGKETITAPSIHNAFPQLPLAYIIVRLPKSSFEKTHFP